MAAEGVFGTAGPLAGKSPCDIGKEVEAMLAGKTAQARRDIAANVGGKLDPDLSTTERLSAEALARLLAEDAIEAVRQALAISVRESRHLPRDIALKIAHDVDSVSTPFLEVTEVFSEEDLQQLILTVSEGARAAVARRPHLPQSVATSLAEIGGAYVAQDLASNESAELGEAALAALVSRFHDRLWLLEQIAARPYVPLSIVEQLISKVSDAAREKLLARHPVPDFVEPLVVTAKMSALLRVIRDAPQNELSALAEAMDKRGELTPILILQALKNHDLAFFEAAMAIRANIPLSNARKLVREGGLEGTIRLAKKAKIPMCLHQDMMAGVEFSLEALKGHSGAARRHAS
jgi:uncharacterized protein (DUF2336 family)